ncbi:MAG: PKD domain-containing protein [Bacteroidales bacterium]|nr:PKD domain-containing protein [Bacteroidales bacterium]
MDFWRPHLGSFNTSDLQNPTHTYAAAGNYTVSLKTYTANGCHDSVAYQLTILPLPVADFVFEAACQGNPAQFNPSGMALGTIASWFWNFGDGNTSTLQAPSHIYTFAGTYSVTLSVTDTSGCSRSVTHPLTIVTPPVVNFDFNSPNCDDMAVQFNDLSTAPAGYIVRWTWDFGDGNTQSITFPSTASVSHTYTQGGTFNVSLWVKTSDSCSSLLSKTLTGLPKPSADFNHGSACLGASVSFTDASLSNTTGGITTWNWNFGDPTSGTFNSSTLQNPTHIFNTAGTYSVKLKVFIAGGCYDSIIMPVVVTPPPTVDFSAVAGCGGILLPSLLSPCECTATRAGIGVLETDCIPPLWILCISMPWQAPIPYRSPSPILQDASIQRPIPSPLPQDLPPTSASQHLPAPPQLSLSPIWAMPTAPPLTYGTGLLETAPIPPLPLTIQPLLIPIPSPVPLLYPSPCPRRKDAPPPCRYH